MAPIHHTLDGEMFQRALERYVDENKPDPLVLKQIEKFEMSWDTTQQERSGDAENEGSSKLGCPADLSFTPTDVIHGVLTWNGDYMCAEIEALCCWAPHVMSDSTENNGTNKMPSHGSLYFALRPTLRFRTKHDKRPGDESKSKEERKADEKLRSRMIKRLKEDIFIKKLVPDTLNNDSIKKSSSEHKQPDTILCEARVSVNSSENGSDDANTSGGQFEERVDVTDSVAEGLRRGLFSSAESALDVAELLLSLPILPCKAHKILLCPLADRAKLRLLEDAMFDACEREGEDEIIDDLKISSQDKSEHSTETAPNESPQKKSNKRSKR